jgi:hypothetical protein
MDSSQEAAAHSDVPVYPDPVDGTSIRLLRFWQPNDGEFVGKLQTFRLASAPHFYTVSRTVQALPPQLIILGELCMGCAAIRRDEHSSGYGVFAGPAQSRSLLAYGDTT